MVESTLPLRSENAAGEEQAVDLGLGRGEGELSPVNPLIEVGIPSQVGEGVSLPEAGVGTALAGAPGATPAADVEGELAFYPGTARDTDLIVAPTPQGVETMTDARSAAAPKQTTYQLSLPPGPPSSRRPRGAEVVEDGQRKVMVSPPSSLDAAGEAVPTELMVGGGAIMVETTPIPTTAYPILVDPQFVEEGWNWTYLHHSLGSWRGNSSTPAYQPSC